MIKRCITKKERKYFFLDIKKIFTNNIKTESKNISDIEEKNTGKQFDLFNQPGIGINDNNNKSKNDQFYQYVNTQLGYDLLIEELLKQKTVSFDTETDSIRALEAKLIGLAFSWSKNKGYYLIIPDNKKEAEKVLSYFIPFFKNIKIEKVGHNLKYDLKVLQLYW